jgi:hypothetical protein
MRRNQRFWWRSPENRQRVLTLRCFEHEIDSTRARRVAGAVAASKRSLRDKNKDNRKRF